MARKSATLEIKILGDASSATKAFGQTESKMGGLLGKMGGLTAGVGVAAGAIGALAVSAFNSASELEQQAGAVDAIFGKNAAKMHGYAAAAAQTVGLAESEYSQLASVLGSQLSNAGFAGDKLTGTVDGLVSKGADLAAQFGGSTADAVSALSGVLKGETDPIERYGISIKQSDISARLAAQGQDKLTGSALKNATAQAALALVTEQSKSATGAFGRESDTASGKTARLGAWFENAKAKLGAGLLPIFVKAADFVSKNVVPAINKLTERGGPLGDMFAEVGRYITGTVVPAFSKIWGFLNSYVIPIFKTWLIPQIKGVRDIFHTLSEKLATNSGKFEGLYRAVKPVLEFLRDKVAPLVGGALATGFGIAARAVGGLVDALGWVVEKVSWLINKGASIGSWIGGLFGAPAVPAAGPTGGPVAAGGLFGAAPGLRGATMYSSAGGSVGPGAAGGGFASGDVYNITVNGALDPAAVADQIGRLLDARARRLGVRTAAAFA